MQLLPAWVTFDREGVEDPNVGTNGEKVGLIPRPEI
jgi:hypothetical protein